MTQAKQYRMPMVNRWQYQYMMELKIAVHPQKAPFRVYS